MHISLCLSRQHIAAATAADAEIEACLAETNLWSARIEQMPELVPAMVALFGCFRGAPSATCYRVDDGSMPRDRVDVCVADAEDDAGAAPQTCLEQCLEEWPDSYSCLPDDPDQPEVCKDLP